MAATVFSKLYYRSKNFFNFGNANVGSFASWEYGAEPVETFRKKNQIKFKKFINNFRIH